MINFQKFHVYTILTVVFVINWSYYSKEIKKID